MILQKGVLAVECYVLRFSTHVVKILFPENNVVWEEKRVMQMFA